MRLRRLNRPARVGDFVVIRVLDHSGGDNLAPILTAGVVILIDEQKVSIDHWYDEMRETSCIDKSTIDLRLINDMGVFKING